jgi:hypothetical protein
MEEPKGIRAFRHIICLFIYPSCYILYMSRLLITSAEVNAENAISFNLSEQSNDLSKPLKE